MNRRQFLSRSAAGLAISAVRSNGAHGATKSASGRPNVLFIIADDLSFRALDRRSKLGVKTPHLDRLREEGCSFTHAFHQGSWSGAICVPSRTMLNTGLTAFKAEHAIPTNESCDVPTWGQTFREAGYDTFITGKWHLDAVSLQRSFAEQAEVGPGFLPSTPSAYNRPSPGNTWSPSDQSGKGHWLDMSLWRKGTSPTVEHSSCVCADAAVKYLEGTKKKESPFLMYVGFNAPHDPRQAPQEFLDLYPMEDMKAPPNFVPVHPFDQGMAHGRDEMLAPFPRTEEAVKTHRREYYAIISHMDQQIGRILDALDASGHSSNTYVIFTADHGLAVGEHGLLGKQNQYECSMRMPLLVRGPGIQAGRQVDELVYQHCLFATTCDLAGIPVPRHVEFPSLVPMLHEAKPAPLYEAVFGWITNIQRSTRTKQHRLIFYPRLNRYQLFDMEQDPWERTDLAADPQHASTLLAMKNQMQRLQESLGDPILKA